MWWELRIYSPDNFNYIYHVVHDIPSTDLSYYWKYLSFGYIHSIPLPSTPPPPPLVTTNLISFSMSSFVFEVWMTYNIMLVFGTQYSDLILLYISYLWHLFCNWKFASLNFLHLFLLSPFWQSQVFFSEYMKLSALLCFFICFF